ncbi:MAG TPA: hypothetical protein VKB76_13780, partial [Ktedonobacterales bacterium]|nr:hypothetical protein [Ktedonobacterales bacterium]
SSTDFLEWGDLASRGVIAGVQRLRMTWLVVALPVLVALAILVDALRVIPGLTAAPSIIETIAIVSAGVIVVLLAGIDRTWSSVTQITALFVGALYLFLSDELANELAFLLHLNASDAQQLTNVVTLTLWIAAATLGGILLLWRHGQHASQGRAVGLLLLLIVLFDLPGISHNFVAATGLHASPLPPLNQATFLFLCALISLVVILITALRRSLSDAVPTFASVLCFLVGVRIVFWVFNISEHPSLSTQTSAIIAALTFLAAVVWDVLTSGESITNRDSRPFPRAGRILIYLGYTLIAASMFILFSTLHPQVLQADNGSLPLFNLDGPFLAFGITELGIPFIITTFALSLSQG